MASVHEGQVHGSQVQGPNQPASLLNDGGDTAEVSARPYWIQRHFFVVFVASSLIFHAGLIGVVSFFDFRWAAPWMNLREIPVELVNEEQAQKDEKKAGSEEAKGQRNAPAKNGQSGTQPKPPETQAEKPAQPPEEQNKPAENKPAENKPVEDKQSDNKSSENSQSENKPAESKPTETKSPETKPDEKKMGRNAASQRQSQAVAKQEAQLKELAKQAAQKPAEPQQPTPPQAQEQRSAAPQQPRQQASVASQQSQQAATSPATAPTRLPAFMYQQSDHLSLAIPAPLPTNDTDAEPVSYKVIVFGMLERAKNYPPGARERHAMGHVVVAFSIDDNGQPRNISMLESSGEGDLDTEAVAMISRAAPFPVPPAGAQRDFAVNIGFGGR
jgi:colicin import membrane protein